MTEAETKPEKPKDAETKPEKPKDADSSLKLIDAANMAAERLESANKQLKELLTKQEQLAVQSTLGGHTEAGIGPKSEEERIKAEAKKYLAGTGFEDEI